MACDVWRTKLDAYVDGELTADEMGNLQAHLRDCASCTSDLLSRTVLKRAVQNAGMRYYPDHRLRERIQSMLPRRKDAFWTRKWIPVFMAAAVLVVVGLFAFQRWASSQREQIFSELTDLHVAALASSNPVDVLSSDRHTVKPWFQGRIPFAFNLPETGFPFMLLGGRVAYLAQMPGAQLMYELRKHRISVFIFQDQITPVFTLSNSRSRHKTFNIESWKQDGLHFFAVGDANSDDIHGLCESLRRAAAG